ncbi:hypothetical protein Tco_0027533 [Tanacetum coccineum]
MKMYQEDHKKDEAEREKQLAEREKLFGRVEEIARGIETLQTEGWELESGNRRKTSPANRRGGRLQQPRYGRLDFPVYDGKNDPLVWLSHCEHYFRHQHIPEAEKVEIACYHLDEDAQVWFGPIVQGNKLEELCKLRQTSTVEEYQRKFKQLVTRAGILTAEQEVEIFVSKLQEDIGLEVELHRPTGLTRAMSLARLYEKRGGSREVTNNITKSSTNVAPGSSPNKKVFKNLSHLEMEERRAKGLCFNCD